jgi:nicotinamidase-related amidase
MLLVIVSLVLFMPTLKSRPSPINLDLKQTALLVIDVQKDFVCHGGYGESLGNNVELLRRVIAPTKKLLDAWRQAGLLVIHTREGHKPNLSDCPETKLIRWPEGSRIGDPGPMGRILIVGAEGQDIVPELYPLPGEIVIDKPGKNSFVKTNLENILLQNNIKYILVAGVTTDVCCFTTVTAANDLGFHPIVLEDCVASYSPERHKAALDIITAQGGIFGYTISSTDLVEALKPGRSTGITTT